MIPRVALLFFATGCSSPSVDVHVTTDVPCQSIAPAIVTWAPAGQTPTQANTFFLSACTGIGDLGAVILTPDTSAPAIDVVVVASTSDPTSNACLTAPGGTCIVARRRVSLPSDRVELPIELDASCTGISCDPTSTCMSGQCVAE